MHPNPLNLTAHEFAAAYTGPGGRRAALDRYAALYREGRTHDDLLSVTIPPITRTHTSESAEGDVVKFTQALPPAQREGPGVGSVVASLAVINAPAAPTLETESVLIPMVGKSRVRHYTLCVSSQVGCAMGCTFCQTAQMGLIRSLTPAEIVSQWFAAQHLVTRPDPAAKITNIVFMGMGEPMDNLDAVIQAIRILTDHRGPSISCSRITVSTVGRTDGIRRLAELVRNPGWHRLGLAISLNAPTDEIRSRLMPINRAVPLSALRSELEHWPLFSSAHLCFEYVLIPGVNDQPDHADALASFVLGHEYTGPSDTRYPGPRLQGIANIIPYNPRHDSPWPAPSEDSIEAFTARLSATGVYVTRRRTKGRDTMAACGQLGNPEIQRKQLRAAGML